MDFTETQKEYQGQVKLAHESLSDEYKEARDFVISRIAAMSLVKSDMMDRWQRNQDLHDVFLRTTNTGDETMPPIRFPTAFGIGNRFFAEVMENEPDVEVESVSKKPREMVQCQALGFTVEDVKDVSNYRKHKKRAIRDMTGPCGNGFLHVGYKEGCQVPIFRRVDPRNFYMDEACETLHDDDVRAVAARDCAEDVIMTLTSFRKFAKEQGWDNWESVYGVDKTTSIAAVVSAPYDAEAIQNGLTAGQYVHLFYYYNTEQDMLIPIANGIPMKIGTLTEEYPHGKLPYAHYQMYENNESAWAYSWLDIVYQILIQNDLLNTFMMDQLKFSLNRPMVIDGNLEWNPDGELLRPGAVIRVNGLNAGADLKQRMQILETGQVDQNYYQARTILSDELTMATGDDMRGLYANPNQLATQTAYKHRTLNKLLKSIIVSNEIDASRDEAELILETMKVLVKDNKERPAINIRGYKAKQASRGKKTIDFEKSPNTEDSFILTPDIFDVKYRIKIKPKTTNDKDNDDAVRNTLQFLQTIMPLAQALPEFAEKVDVYSLVYDTAKRLGVDMTQVFPQIQDNSTSKAEEIVSDILSMREPDISNISDVPQTIQDMAAIRQSDTYAQMTVKQKQTFDVVMRAIFQSGGQSQAQAQQGQMGALQGQQMNPNVSIPTPSVGMTPAAEDKNGMATSATAQTIGK